jgi:hypothetical protein
MLLLEVRLRSALPLVVGNLAQAVVHERFELACGGDRRRARSRSKEGAHVDRGEAELRAGASESLGLPRGAVGQRRVDDVGEAADGGSGGSPWRIRQRRRMRGG